MNRLLFAAARGARLQRRSSDGDDWLPCFTAGLAERIHPDDAHLQYGPISTALREFALSDGDWSHEIEAAFVYTLKRWPGWDAGLFGNDYCVTLLFMAEYLADEGL